MKISLKHRPRRNRVSESVRSLVRENRLQVENLIMPLFVIDGDSQQQEVESMPGIFRFSSDLIVRECRELHQL
ncbi:MAG: porphobilinogen synthase, partial [Proteobacteria bacterium]|nr:porphobilinogen synthase [Pseudomonadota bacterium]